MLKNQEQIEISSKKFIRKSIIAFVIFISAIFVAIFVWKWIHRQPDIAGSPKPIRKVLSLDEKVFSKVLSDNHLVKTYSESAGAKNVRLNGDLGLKSALDSSWKLKIAKSPGDTVFLTLDDLKSLPKTEITFDFKCIEGWSQISHWGGVKFSDLARRYNLLSQSEMSYAGLITPDKQYYVGIDMASMMHPQTLLCYEMNGKPLPLKHGYPLRLIIPVKYGIKSLKRIGTLFFSNTPPPDYWYERGYDYYSGL